MTMRLSHLYIILVALLLTFVGCKRDHYYDVEEDPPPEESYSHDHSEHSDDTENSDDTDGPDSPDPSEEKNLITLASVLTGHWQGTITTQFYDDNGSLHKGIYDTEMVFEQKEGEILNGHGLETDYKDGKMVYRSSFSWMIETKSEDIHLKYDADQREMVMVSFHIDNKSFYGTMKSTDGWEIDEFNLTRSL